MVDTWGGVRVKKLKLLMFGFVIALSLVIASPVVMAKSAADCNAQSFFGVPTWYEYLSFDGSCSPKTDAANAIILIIFAVIDIIIYIGGLIAAFYIIYGGFEFILAQGSPDKITSARSTILNAVIGLVIVLVASQLVSFIAKRIAGL